MKPEEMSIEQLDAALDEIEQRKQALKNEAAVIMAVRNRKISLRELKARENPTQIMGLPDAGRLERLRTQAGIAHVNPRAN